MNSGQFTAASVGAEKITLFCPSSNFATFRFRGMAVHSPDEEL